MVFAILILNFFSEIYQWYKKTRTFDIGSILKKCQDVYICHWYIYIHIYIKVHISLLHSKVTDTINSNFNETVK